MFLAGRFSRITPTTFCQRAVSLIGAFCVRQMVFFWRRAIRIVDAVMTGREGGDDLALEACGIFHADVPP